ncbi:MAG: hypothetical protein CMP22_06125 [Rickettsiales bacterium]|nr:hypothetical protein [Rickettsiales bacterium]
MLKETSNEFSKIFLVFFLVFGLFITVFVNKANAVAVVDNYVSLISNEVNMRTGPGYRYPIEWIYQREGLPVEIIDRFEHWRQIRDIEGTTGWVHKTLLSSKKTVIVTQDMSQLFETSGTKAKAIALIEKGTIGNLDRCRIYRCYVSFGEYEGWVGRTALWGIE